MLDRAKHIQVGAVVAGRGLNFRHWCEELKRQGYIVLYCDGYAAYFKER